MAARDVLKNINIFVDGRGYAGQVQDFTPPPLALQVEEYRAGGMDAPLDVTMGMEKMVSSFNLLAYDKDVLSLFGVAEGSTVQWRAFGALESYDGTVRSVQFDMRGKITNMDPGTWTPGQLAPLNITMTLTYFKQQIDGQTIHEIDVENMIRIINGTDALALIRQALGM